MTPEILYAGCLESDPFFSLKQCDEAILSRLESCGVQVVRLHEQLPKGRFFRRLNRNLLYPLLVWWKTRRARHSEAVSGAHSILHVSSHCYAHLIPFAGGPVTITCHGLSEHYFPEDMTHAQMRRWSVRCGKMNCADHVIAVSEFVKDDLVRLFQMDSSKISVSYNGVSDFFEQEVCAGPSARFSVFNAVEGDLFYVLSVGTNLHVKNMPVLLRAVKKVRQLGVPAVLVKAGDRLHQTHQELIDELQLDDVVFDAGRATERDLKELYNRCDALAFPSFYEGFGLPVVEAQKCGLPCVISNAASLPEVGGSAALYHNPEDSDQLATQLRRVSEDSELQENMIKGGLRHSKHFRWDVHVLALIDLFNVQCGNGWLITEM